MHIATPQIVGETVTQTCSTQSPKIPKADLENSDIIMLILEKTTTCPLCFDRAAHILSEHVQTRY